MGTSGHPNKIQIFPFFIPENSFADLLVHSDEQTIIKRGLLLEKHIFDPENWFLTDNSKIEDICFWKPCASESNLIAKGIELSKNGVVCKQKTISKGKKIQTFTSKQKIEDYFTKRRK